MIGTIVNTRAIMIGTVAGTLIKKGIKKEYQEALFLAMGWAATALGINAVVSHLPDSHYPILFIVSLAVGSLAGAAINLDEKFKNLVKRYSKSNLSEGLSTAVLLYCNRYPFHIVDR